MEGRGEEGEGCMAFEPAALVGGVGGGKESIIVANLNACYISLYRTEARKNAAAEIRHLSV